MQLTYFATDEMASLYKVQPYPSTIDRGGDLVTVAFTMRSTSP